MTEQLELQCVKDALDIISKSGWIDGACHKQWVIDQVARALLGDKYTKRREQFLDEYGEDTWDEGSAP